MLEGTISVLDTKRKRDSITNLLFIMSMIRTQQLQDQNDFDSLVQYFAQEPGHTSAYITVVSFCSSADTSWGIICDIAKRNFFSYTQKHAYGLHFFTTMPPKRSRVPQWYKLPASAAVLKTPKVQFVFWADGDSLFMTSKPLTSLLPIGKIAITFSRDTGTSARKDGGCFMNSGHFMLHGIMAQQLLREAWEIYPAPYPETWFEQSSLVFLLGGSRRHCRVAVASRYLADGPQLCGQDKKLRCSSWDFNGEYDGCCEEDLMAGPWAELADVRVKHEMNAWANDFLEGTDSIVQFAGYTPKVKLEMMLAWSHRANLTTDYSSGLAYE